MYPRRKRLGMDASCVFRFIWHYVIGMANFALLHINCNCLWKNTGTSSISHCYDSDINCCAVCYGLYLYGNGRAAKLPFTMNMTRLYDQGAMNSGAGIFSGLFGIPIVSILGFTGAKIVILIVLLSC